MTDSQPESFVSSGDAAAYIGVSKDALQGWIRDGLVIPTIITPGGMVRWQLSDLVRQLRPDRPAAPGPGGQAG